MRLGEAHRRGISVTLGLLDQALCEMESWAKGREVRSVLYEERNDLSEDQRREILREVEDLRGILRQIIDFLGLRSTRRGAREEIWARCSGLWESLVELEGKYLRRYGEVPPKLAEYMDSQVAALIEGLQRICSIVSSG